MLKFIAIVLSYFFVFACVHKGKKVAEVKLPTPPPVQVTSQSWAGDIKSGVDKILDASKEYLNTVSKVEPAENIVTQAPVSPKAKEAGPSVAAPSDAPQAAQTAGPAVTSESNPSVVAGASEASPAPANAAATAENPQISSTVAAESKKIENSEVALASTLTMTAAYVVENHEKIKDVMAQCPSCLSAAALQVLSEAQKENEEQAPQNNEEQKEQISQNPVKLFRNISAGLFFIPVVGFVAYDRWIRVKNWIPTKEYKKAMNNILWDTTMTESAQAVKAVEDGLKIEGEKFNMFLLFSEEENTLFQKYERFIFTSKGELITTATRGKYDAAAAFKKVLEEERVLANTEKTAADYAKEIKPFIDKYINLADGTVVTSRAELANKLSKSPEKFEKLTAMKAEKAAYIEQRVTAATELLEKNTLKMNKGVKWGLITAAVLTGAAAVYAESVRRDGLDLVQNEDCNSSPTPEGRYFCRLSEVVKPLLVKGFDEANKQP